VLRRSDVGISKFDLPGVARQFGVSVQAVFVGLARLRLVSWGLARRACEDPGIRDQILGVRWGGGIAAAAFEAVGFQGLSGWEGD
jgi:hypothetical protein